MHGKRIDPTMTEANEDEPLRNAGPRESLSPAARRALEEAEQRRAAATPEDRPREINGRSGPEPVRYGDWEVKGLTTDF